MENKIQRPKDLAGILEDEKLLMNSAKLRQWREDTKVVMGLNDKGTYKDIKDVEINKEKIKKEYEINHCNLCKENLILRLEILNEILNYFD